MYVCKGSSDMFCEPCLQWLSKELNIANIGFSDLSDFAGYPWMASMAELQAKAMSEMQETDGLKYNWYVWSSTGGSLFFFQYLD